MSFISDHGMMLAADRVMVGHARQVYGTMHRDMEGQKAPRSVGDARSSLATPSAPAQHPDLALIDQGSADIVFAALYVLRRLH